MHIDIKADLSEWVNYNTAGFPLYFRKGILSVYPNYAAERHWHDDLEFIVILSGKMLYNVNGKLVTIEKGNGIFINSRQFHFGFSDDFTECEFLCVLIHPVLLTASQYIEQKYVTPVLNEAALPYLLLHNNVPWERNILTAIADIFSSDALEQMILLYRIWNELCKNKQNIYRESGKTSAKLNVLKNMISFMQSHYKEKISLADIAKAGLVGKTECCGIFHAYTQLTPMAFLNDFRLRKSIELLEQTDMTVSEICYEVGFSGASYFAEIFGRTFHCSPREYRKNRLHCPGAR